MATIRYELNPGEPLPPEETARLQKLAESLKERPVNFDEDCPPLTADQLAEVKRISAERRKHA